MDDATWMALMRLRDSGHISDYFYQRMVYRLAIGVYFREDAAEPQISASSSAAGAPEQQQGTTAQSHVDTQGQAAKSGKKHRELRNHGVYVNQVRRTPDEQNSGLGDYTELDGEAHVSVKGARPSRRQRKHMGYMAAKNANP